MKTYDKMVVNASIFPEDLPRELIPFTTNPMTIRGTEKARNLPIKIFKAINISTTMYGVNWPINMPNIIAKTICIKSLYLWKKLRI